MLHVITDNNMIDNKFYVAKKDHDVIEIFPGYSWASGSWTQTGDNTVCSSVEIDVRTIDFLRTDVKYRDALYATYYFLDKNKSVILQMANQPQAFSIKVPEKAYYFAIDIKFSKEMSRWDSFYTYMYHEVTPHYKTLSKKYKRETNQMFFRESLDGKINLFGQDFELINNAGLGDTLVFDIYRGTSRFATNEFNKTDCKFDRAKKSVELKLIPNDKYTNILDKYKNSYDLIKCAPATSWLTLTKRCILQIYVQGESVISNYSGGTYWETDVNSPVDDADELRIRYYFYPGPVFNEINLTGFNYQINSSFLCNKSKDCWNAVSYIEAEGQKYRMPCSIKFTKKAEKGDITTSISDIAINLSDGVTSSMIDLGERGYEYGVDAYRIEIYTGLDGTGTKIYQSKSLYGANDGFSMQAGNNLYPMERIAQPTPQKDPTPNEFNLGAYMVEYRTWIRELCDTDKIGDTPTYDLPYDDFATERNNYKKCIGLDINVEGNAIIHVRQAEATSEEPTAYGQNDFGFYFKSPYAGLGRHGYLPLSRSAWGNTSLWVYFDADGRDGSYEAWASKTYKEYTTKDNYHIAEVIKALLSKIDKTIKHEATPEFSEFLYGSSEVASSFALEGCQLYMSQKTNILKGEYDQPAQKAETSLENVMTMLRECFQCYWYIDSENRFRIEHIRYFLNGYSYTEAGIGIDLTIEKDKFNKKPALYCQQELEYQKSDIKSRYEFGWADDVTDAMGNIAINFTDNYVPKDSTEDVSVANFCPDVDYMIFRPDDFSNDGFALMLAKNGKVPIVAHEIWDPKQNEARLNLYTQNWYLSWRNLIWHRTYNAPSYNLTLDEHEGPNDWFISEISHIMQHDIEMQTSYNDMTKLIKTAIGNGYIEDMSTNVDTNKSKITLSYEPS